MVGTIGLFFWNENRLLSVSYFVVETTPLSTLWFFQWSLLPLNFLTFSSFTLIVIYLFAYIYTNSSWYVHLVFPHMYVCLEMIWEDQTAYQGHLDFPQSWEISIDLVTSMHVLFTLVKSCIMEENLLMLNFSSSIISNCILKSVLILYTDRYSFPAHQSIFGSR